MSYTSDAFVSDMVGVFGEDYRKHLEVWVAARVREYGDRVDFKETLKMVSGIKKAYPDAQWTDAHGFYQNFPTSTAGEFVDYVRNPSTRNEAVSRAYGIDVGFMGVKTSGVDGNVNTEVVHFDMTPFDETRLLVYFNTAGDVAPTKKS